MSRRLWFITIACVALGTITAHAQQAPATDTNKAIAIVNLGAITPAQLQEMTKFMKEQLNVPIREVSQDAPAEADLQAAGRAVAGKALPTDVCTIVLVKAPDSVKEPMLVAPDSGWAVVNVSVLLPGKPDAVTLQRRIERQTMRALGNLFGIGFSPDPLGVNRSWATLQDLDAMGRSFSPPSLNQFYTECSSKGLGLTSHPRKKRKQAQVPPVPPTPPAPGATPDVPKTK